MMRRNTLILAAVTGIIAAFLHSLPVLAKDPSATARTKQVVGHWTADRRKRAIPRDLVIDERGLGYLRRADGSLQPYGHNKAPQLRSSTPKPVARPSNPGGGGGGGGSDDANPPVISGMDPGAGAVIGSSQLFSATVTDAESGIKSVNFVMVYPDGRTQSFSPAYVGGDTWQITLQGFTNGNWGWRVVAKDNAKKGGNTATSNTVNFTVDTGTSGGGGSGGYIVSNAEWTNGGAVQTALGRIYFEMPNNAGRRRWSGYVCSGTVATDSISGRSVILTAAHCVYDDANKAFARNVLFIPNQADTSGSGTDLNCNNDPLGCWVPSFGVVDENWTTRTFPDNIEWDYAYYVVSDSGAHTGATASSALDGAAGSLNADFNNAYVNDGDPSETSLDFTHALGYSYDQDPNLMYCAEDMTTEGAVNWWLPSCELSGGSSGGAWFQPMDTSTGSGPIISVNSWGYTTSPGMAGPKLVGTSAGCLFGEAEGIDFAAVPGSDGDAGVTVGYCP